MLLAKMENYSSLLFPSLPMDEAFQLPSSYNDGLFGRKRKKKSNLGAQECRLDSPCNSPEIIVSALLDDDVQSYSKLFPIDSFTVDGGLFGTDDMEAFYEIDVSNRCYGTSITADEDIMLSSSAKESSKIMMDMGTKLDLPIPRAEANSESHTSRTVSASGLQLEFQNAVDSLLINNPWESKEVEQEPVQDLLTDFSCLLSDIPSHPDLSCEAIDALLTYCADKDDGVNSSSGSSSESSKTESTFSVKSEPEQEQDSSDDVYRDLVLIDDVESHTSKLSCKCCGHQCTCFKFDGCSTEEDDVQYLPSRSQSKVRRVKRKSSRRGPGRPRKSENVEFVRRGPGRPRKKSISDAVVWYQTRRKRTVSFSSGCKPRNRQKSVSDDKAGQSSIKTGKMAQLKKSQAKGYDAAMSSDQLVFDTQRLPSLHSSDTDEEDIVDVESIGEEFHERYGVSTMSELVQHINLLHSYHTQRFHLRHSCSPDRKSQSKFSINLAMPAKSMSPTRWSDSLVGDGRRRRVTQEQRSKREALNDLERRRRYALARELSSLRDVVPEMKEGFRAAKVVILASAENHIRVLERKLKRDQSILKAERERHATLKARLSELSVNTCE